MRDFLKGFLGQPQTPERLKEMLEEAAAVEREACAKVCEAKPLFRTTLDGPSIREQVGKRLAAEIRARGNS